MVLTGLPLVPGAVAYMLMGGVHGSTLSEEAVFAVFCGVSGGFWALLLPYAWSFRHPIRRLREWRDSF
ncbi:MAG: hypothetical protein JWO05_1034 [Gemmatimonadetes bacterium]|nr:hypothetical protein [Gemmatimonadota bacterium]